MDVALVELNIRVNDAKVKASATIPKGRGNYKGTHLGTGTRNINDRHRQQQKKKKQYIEEYFRHRPKRIDFKFSLYNASAVERRLNTFSMGFANS